jgi:hypothetical protein
MKKIYTNRGEGEISVIVVVGLVAWGIFAIFGGEDSQGRTLVQDDSERKVIMQEHPNYQEYEEAKDCSALEPENPYDEGSGHYAGFEWGENGNACGGNSDSFIEGCEEYDSEAAAYAACENS